MFDMLRMVKEQGKKERSEPRSGLVRFFGRVSYLDSQIGSRRQFVDLLANQPLRCGEVELGLQIHPELRFDSEPVPEPKCTVSCNGSLARDYLADSVGRHIDLSGKC